ncbi:MAG: CCA tRNA nucleotidyltransferase [Candidatus Micrarchaeia archaeon]
MVEKDSFTREMWEKMRVQILKEVKPTPEQHAEVRKIADELVDKLNKISPTEIEVMLTGSFAKETYIRSDVDFDIFVLFPEKYTLYDLQTMTFEWAKKFLENWEVAYAQHPYLRGYYKGHHVDVVPSYKLKEGEPVKIKSAVDRTQLHTKYVLSKITEEQKDDVRILKKFLKRLGIYGAEIKTGGFSGYLCELLIMKYGSFYDLIMAARKWQFPVAIDMAGGRSERLLRALFKGDVLIVTDPVDKKRNVASPVSADSLSKFVAAAHVFFLKPAVATFFTEIEIMPISEIRKKAAERGTYFVLFEFPRPEKADDILWGELRKTLTSIEKSFDKEGFDCSHQTAEVHEGKCYMLFELMHEELPNIILQEGPYVRMGEHLEKFIREEMNNFDIFVKDERMCAVRKRKFTTVLQLVADIQARPHHYGVSKGIAKEVSSARVYAGDDSIFQESRKVYTMHLNRKFFLGL